MVCKCWFCLKEKKGTCAGFPSETCYPFHLKFLTNIHGASGAVFDCPHLNLHYIG